MRRKDEEHSLKMEEREKKEAEEREQEREKNIRREMELKRERLVGGGGGDDMDREEGVSPPPSKRPHPSEELRTESRGEVHGITGLTLPQGVNLPGTNIKITSRGQYLLINKPSNFLEIQSNSGNNISRSQTLSHVKMAKRWK